VGAGRGLLIAALPDTRASSRHRLAAPVVGMGDQARCDQGSGANRGGDAEVGWLIINQLEGRVISCHDSQKQEGNA
jgi:hypothetical protein